MSFNVISHSSYEFYPKGFTRNSWFRFKTATTHHNMHHAKFNGNYSLYFTWWDTIMGTEFKNYHETFDAVHERIDAAKNAEAQLTPQVQKAEA